MKAKTSTRQLELPTKAEWSLQGIEAEMWLARRIGLHGIEVVFRGDTDAETRKERMRKAILDSGLEAVVCGRGPGQKPNTYAEAFQRLYGVKL